jgi:hypothetical protein
MVYIRHWWIAWLLAAVLLMLGAALRAPWQVAATPLRLAASDRPDCPAPQRADLSYLAGAAWRRRALPCLSPPCCDRRHQPGRGNAALRRRAAGFGALLRQIGTTCSPAASGTNAMSSVL